MLYISRFVGLRGYGVVDTDDGVEEILSRQQLEEAVIKYGIEIKGVITKSRNWEHWIAKVEVYQPPESVIKQQAKSKVLLGVDVKVFDDRITAIEWTASPNDKERVVRLSDYGTHVGAKVLNRMSVVYNKHTTAKSFLTIILDDKLTCDNKAFMNASSTDVKFDLREVTENRIAFIFYNNYITQYTTDADMTDHIIDVPDRFDYYFGVKACNFGIDYDPGANSLSLHVSDVKTVIKDIGERYHAEFMSLSSQYTFDLLEDDEFGSIRRDISEQLEMYMTEHQNIIRSWDFDLLWKVYDDNDSIRPLSHALGSNIKSPYTKQLARFVNYLMYFEQPDELKAEFVKLFHRILDRMFQLCIENDWLSEEMIQCYISVDSSAQTDMG